MFPELWVGDFNSVPEDLPDRSRRRDPQTFPREKDKTDGELATLAIERGATSLVLVGAFGGERGDHAFLHLALALRLAEAGVPVLLSSGTQEGVPLPHGKAGFDYADGTLFSVLGFSDLSGLTVTAPNGRSITSRCAFGSSLTISNEARGRLEVALGHGRALLLAHPYPFLKADMAPPLLTLDGIKLTFGGTPLLDGAAFRSPPATTSHWSAAMAPASRRC